MEHESQQRDDERDPDTERDAPDPEDAKREDDDAGGSSSEPALPFDPGADDDSPLGDTDEHSSA
jgi:hypothetical protein